jgi:metal-dependent amidase/aminoacylase/carboxypeptidase family protein
VAQIHTGTIDNIIPETAYMNGTVRTFDKDVKAMVCKRMSEIVAGHSTSSGVDATLRYRDGYPPTINNSGNADFAIGVGDDRADGDRGVEMGAEDFSSMLEERPRAYLFLGIGEAVGLHNPNYDFNDEASPYGASFFARLVETAQPL